MRLPQKTRVAIATLFRKYFPEGKLYLFGSRVNPSARGGDIDLLCEQDGDTKILLDQKAAFLSELYATIGEQKIDFVLYRPSHPIDSPIVRIAKETGIRIDMNNNIKYYLDTAERHNHRLAWAMSQMQRWMPLTAERFEKLTNEELAALEMFASRFGKLQNILGVKILPLILEITQEPGDYPTFIDKLNRLEKIGAIPSADAWSLFREIRNGFTHDYPDDPELNADFLNHAYEQGKQLQITFDHIKKYIGKINL